LGDISQWIEQRTYNQENIGLHFLAVVLKHQQLPSTPCIPAVARTWNPRLRDVRVESCCAKPWAIVLLYTVWTSL